MSNKIQEDRNKNNLCPRFVLLRNRRYQSKMGAYRCRKTVVRSRKPPANSICNPLNLLPTQGCLSFLGANTKHEEKKE